MPPALRLRRIKLARRARLKADLRFAGHSGPFRACRRDCLASHSAEKLLASPHDAKERARLEVLVARDAYGLNAEDWQHLTGTFACGSRDTKAELDEIIARSREFW